MIYCQCCQSLCRVAIADHCDLLPMLPVTVLCCQAVEAKTVKKKLYETDLENQLQARKELTAAEKELGTALVCGCSSMLPTGLRF